MLLNQLHVHISLKYMYYEMMKCHYKYLTIIL